MPHHPNIAPGLVDADLIAAAITHRAAVDLLNDENGGLTEDDDAVAPVYEQSYASERILSEIAASSFDGLRAKACVLRQLMGGDGLAAGSVPADLDATDRLTWSVLIDILSLTDRPETEPAAHLPPSIFVTVEDQLLRINVEYTRNLAAYRRANQALDSESTLDGQAADSSALLTKTYESARVHAMRRLGELSGLAANLVPSTVLGFALKARLLTEFSDGWEEQTENGKAVLNSLIGQLLSAAQLSTLQEPDDCALRMIAGADAGLVADFIRDGQPRAAA